MRVFSHTCSNTEIVCELGCADFLVGVDADSDYPPEVVARLPQPGRDLDLDVAQVAALQPDLVLTSLTLPGHQQVIDELHAAGLRTLVCDPLSLADVHEDIRRIARALGVEERGEALVQRMQAAMQPVPVTGRRPRVLVEWWPKPVIAVGGQSWVHEMIEAAGGSNPWGELPVKSQPLEDADAAAQAPDVVVMSWCGVRVENYRAEVVRRRPHWEDVPAVRHDRIHAISEAFLGRPGPRLVEGHRQLCRVIAEAGACATPRSQGV